MDRRQLLNDNEESLRIAMDGQQSSLWTCMPAIITEVDFTKMTIKAQPTIQGVVIDEAEVATFVNLPLLVDLPLCFPKGGGFIITFPLAVGDEVLVHFASRCIDAWWQSGGIQKPMEFRMHDLSDGFAVPGVCSLPNVVSGISATDVQIRNNAGTAYLSITPAGKIKVLGDLEVTGDIKASGDVVALKDAVPVHLSIHVHGGVTTGGGSTTGPVG